MDDFLLVVLVEKLQLFNISESFYRIFLTWLFLVSVALSYAVFYIMRRKPTTGALGMIGQTGKILREKNGYFQVDVHGEIWRCESSESLRAGDHIRVESVEGITLKVTQRVKQPGQK